MALNTLLQFTDELWTGQISRLKPPLVDGVLRVQHILHMVLRCV
jgi:hypothetical protein